MATPTLTLPHSTFAKIAPESYLAAQLLTPPTLRPNGRQLSQFRPPACNPGSLTHTAGSAVIRAGDTAVVCGIQAEILTASSIADPPRQPAFQHAGLSESQAAAKRRRDGTAEIAALNLLVPNVEMATGCSPAYLPGGGGPPSREAQSISQRILALLLSTRLIDIEELKVRYTPPAEDDAPGSVEETKAYWVLYMSIHVMSLSGSSSLFDVAWASVLAALRDVKLPRAWWDADLEGVICSDLASEARRLSVLQRPFACTWGMFEMIHAGIGQQQNGMEDGNDEMISFGDGRRAWLLADPDELEDGLCAESLTVVLDASQDGEPRMLKVEKSGGVALDVGLVQELVRKSLARWREWDNVIP